MRPWIIISVNSLVAISIFVYGTSFSANNVKIEIGKYGRYIIELSNARKTEPHSSSGSVGMVDAMAAPQPIEQTDTLKLGMGVEFGFTFAVVGGKPFELVPVQIHVIHPAFHLPDGHEMTVDDWSAAAQGIPRFTGWRFEHDWELVPGAWTIQVRQGENVLAEKIFHLQR